MNQREEYLRQISRKHGILREEATIAGLTADDIRGPSRKRHILKARDQVVRRLRDELGLTLTAIGNVVKRDHTTVLASLRRTEQD